MIKRLSKRMEDFLINPTGIWGRIMTGFDARMTVIEKKLGKLMNRCEALQRKRPWVVYLWYLFMALPVNLLIGIPVISETASSLEPTWQNIFTPKTIGIILAIAALALAGYLGFRYFTSNQKDNVGWVLIGFAIPLIVHMIVQLLLIMLLVALFLLFLFVYMFFSMRDDTFLIARERWDYDDE